MKCSKRKLKAVQHNIVLLLLSSLLEPWVKITLFLSTVNESKADIYICSVSVCQFTVARKSIRGVVLRDVTYIMLGVRALLYNNSNATGCWRTCPKSKITVWQTLRRKQETHFLFYLVSKSNSSFESFDFGYQGAIHFWTL